MILEGVGVFALSATVAVPWALWSKAVADFQPLKAALSDMAILTFGGLTISAYTEDPRMLPFVILGGGTGTFCTVWKQRRQHHKELLTARSS